MHALFLNPWYDADLADEEHLLERYAGSIEWCNAVAEAGAARVTILQRFRRASSLRRGPVDCQFISDGRGPRFPAWRDPKILSRFVAEMRPDVVHANGSVHIAAGVAAALHGRAALLWQHHGGPLPRRISRPWLHRSFMRINGVLFTSQDQGREWKSAGCVPVDMPVYDVIESSTDLRPESYEDSRANLGIGDERMLLWVGRLDANKDPITCLNGLAECIRHYPPVRLVMIYRESPLLDDVRRTIERLGLADTVSLVGAVPHDELRQYYSAADVFLLGSRSEGSGFALLEALACGALPVVTDIAPFRAITGGGAVGHLWAPGDPGSLSRALGHALASARDRSGIERFFRERLSYPVLGRRAFEIYSAALRHKHGEHPGWSR